MGSALSETGFLRFLVVPAEIGAVVQKITFLKTIFLISILMLYPLLFLSQEGWTNPEICNKLNDLVIEYLNLEKLIHTRACIWFWVPEYKPGLTLDGAEIKIQNWGIGTLSRWIEP